LTAEHLGINAPVDAHAAADRIGGDTDQTERLADALEHADMAASPRSASTSTRSSALAGARGVARCSPLRPAAQFDVSLPLRGSRASRRPATELVASMRRRDPVLFGHVGEGNLHLNLVAVRSTAIAEALYSR